MGTRSFPPRCHLLVPFFLAALQVDEGIWILPRHRVGWPVHDDHSSLDSTTAYTDSTVVRHVVRVVPVLQGFEKR
jgi:hypothetical protein